MGKMDIGEIFKLYRIMNGLSLAELAQLLSENSDKTIAPQNISAMENGNRIPKIETREEIAHLLNADPVELSGIILTEVDEQRLLCRLLSKYATSISVSDTENEKVKVTLPIAFTDFALEYLDCQKRKEEINNTISSPLRRMIQERSVDEEFEYWLRTYPKYDAVSISLKEDNNTSIDKIQSVRNDVQPALKENFEKFDKAYLQPKLFKNQ